MSDNYWTTTVAVSKSAEQIRKLLMDHDADSFALLEQYRDNVVGVQFSFKNLPVEFRIHLDNLVAIRLEEKPWSSRMRRSEETYTRAVEEKAKQVAMRILAHHLKAAFLAIEYGLVEFEDVFLSKFLMRDGKTIGEIVVPNLEAVVKAPGLLAKGVTEASHQLTSGGKR